MKSTWIAGTLASIAFVLPLSSYGEDLATKWEGTYSSKETNFVTVKRLTFTKAKDGSLKVHGALVGFPEEVSIGEATAEPYADRNNKANPDIMVASFLSEKYKPLMTLSGYSGGSEHLQSINFTCYMKDADGTKVHVAGNLKREP